VDVPDVPGAQSISLVGRGQPNGVYSARVRLAAGARILPHTHPDTGYSRVFSGTLYVGFGEGFDEAKLVAVPAGTLHVALAHQPHFPWARDGEVIYQESGTNPTATDFIPQTHAERERRVSLRPTWLFPQYGAGVSAPPNTRLPCRASTPEGEPIELCASGPHRTFDWCAAGGWVARW